MDTQAIAFGVGCLHFSYKSAPTFENFSAPKYLKAVRTVLEAVRGVSGINVDAPDPPRLVWMGIHGRDEPDSGSRLDEGPYFFPHIPGLTIEFKLELPQDELSAILGNRGQGSPSASRFLVRIVYSHMWFPIAFVMPLDVIDNAPSSGVRFVWEYLNKAVLRQELSPLVFERLGPSPFHADCFLVVGDRIADSGSQGDDSAAFHVDVVRQRGYWAITFYADRGYFVTPSAACAALWEELALELGYFYYIVQEQNRLAAEADVVADKGRSFIALQRASGWKAPLQRLTASSAVRDIYLSLAELDSSLRMFQHAQERRRDSLYNPGSLRAFEAFIEKRLAEDVSSHARQVGGVITFFENQRVKRLEIIAVVGSATLGGAIGAVATLVLAGG